MPETRYNEVYKDGELVERIPYEVSDEGLHQEALAREFNDVHVAALNALEHWGSLTPAQKDTILRNLLRWALWKDRRL